MGVGYICRTYLSQHPEISDLSVANNSTIPEPRPLEVWVVCSLVQLGWHPKCCHVRDHQATRWQRIFVCCPHWPRMFVCCPRSFLRGVCFVKWARHTQGSERNLTSHAGDQHAALIEVMQFSGGRVVCVSHVGRVLGTEAVSGPAYQSLEGP